MTTATQTAHTPGPWRARDYETKEGNIWVDCEAWKNPRKGTGPLGGTVATVLATGVGVGDVRANARLIAAAPDLLDTLIRAEINLADFGSEEGEYEPTREGCRRIASDLRAAIAKARPA